MFYTYAHSAPNGKVFYIGKGGGSRAFSFSDRGVRWKNFVKESKGVSIEVLAEWNTESEAFAHEQFLIACFKDMGYNLANLTDGGKGVFGYRQSKELRDHKKALMTDYKYKKITCPKCNTSGGETSMKRWHFDNCTGAKIHRARTTVNGKRVFLGNYATKEEAEQVVKHYKDQVTVPSGSTWTVT
jgi:hypothetical protein